MSVFEKKRSFCVKNDTTLKDRCWHAYLHSIWHSVSKKTDVASMVYVPLCTGFSL